MTWQLAVYWLLILATGLALVDWVPLDWRLAERLAASLLIGVVASSLLSLALALWWGVVPAASLGAPLLLLLIALGARGKVWLRRALLGPNAWAGWLAVEWRRKGSRAGLVTAAAVGVIFYLIFTRAFTESAGTISANYLTVWSDWSVHATYAQSFLLGHNLPPRDTLELGTGLRYPFLPDFQSALLETLGQNLWGALDVPSWLISWSAVVLLWHLAYRVTKRTYVAAVAVILVIFGGGLGFIGLYGDGCQQLAHTQPGFSAGNCTSLTAQTPGAAAAFVAHLPTELTHLPRSYDGQDQTDPPLADLEWWEPLLVYWLPQRDFDYGMALVALLSLLLWEAYRGRRKSLLLAAGVGAAALPWFNPFGYLVVILVGLWWLGRQRWWRGLAWYLVPLLLLGLPRMLYVLSGAHGQLDNPLGSNLYPQLDVGWLAHAATSCTATQFNAGDVCDALYLAGASPVTELSYLAQKLAQPAVWGETAGFWLANTGVFTLLALGVVVLRRLPSRARDELRDLELLRFWAPFWLLFLIANLVITQPWNWDNTKLLAYWYAGAAIPVAWLICVVGARRWWRVLADLVILSLILSGLLSLDMALIGQSSLAQTPSASPKIVVAGKQERTVAAAVLQHTSPSAVFLTEGQPDDPVSALAGRTLVLAYYGWLWSYGQPLRTRVRAVETMYAGCSGQGSCAVGKLLRLYDVSYVEFELLDTNRITANLSWYEAQHLPVLVRTQNYVIFKVRRLWSK